VFIGSCYVIHIIFKMLSMSQYTILHLLGNALDTFSNGFLQQGSSHLLQCVHQLWNCFGYSIVFVWLLQAAKMCVSLRT